VTVVWSATALGHLEAIREYISQTSPFYAERMVQRILDRAPQLAAFPDSGRVVSEVGRSDIREVIEGPYRVIYRRTAERLEVLAVVHGRQNRIELGPSLAT
jgi:plasmid stabilization system protein ParE